MPYQFVEDAPTADIGFIATGATLEECFTAAADATLGAMLSNPATLKFSQQRSLAVEADSIELALLKMLEEIIFHKDAHGVFLAIDDVRIGHAGENWSVRARMQGEPIDRGRHELANDVKAVTLHQLRVQRTDTGWQAKVVLDV